MAASDLDWMGWTVIVTLAIALILMATDKVGPDLVFTGLIAFYMAAGIITVSQASANYGNSGLLTVLMLYCVAEGIYQTGGLETIMAFILGRSRSPFWAIVRMSIPSAILSAFLNNTPVVSLLSPILISWGRRCGVPIKKLLIPLSYAAVLGGTTTLIGSSTNLVVSAAQTSRYTKLKQMADIQFGIFDIAPVGVPYAVWGLIFMYLTQRWLLPGNSSKHERDLLTGLRVTATSSVVNRSLLEAGLRHLQGTIVSALLRKGVVTRDPEPDTVLREGDVLYFAGELSQIEFYSEDFGLELVSHESEEGHLHETIAGAAGAHTYSKLVQVTIPATSDLIGHRIAEANLRSRYDACVVAIKRGKRPDGRISDMVVQANDILILDVGNTDLSDEKFKQAFHHIHEVKSGATREFSLSMRVTPGPVVGKTVSGAGLRGIPGLFVVAVERPDGSFTRNDVISASLVLQEGDVIWFAADVAGATLIAKFPGLALAQQQQVEKTGVNILDRTFVQAVVAPRSWLDGRTVSEARVRTRIHAAVVGLHRQDVRAALDVDKTVLQPGDVLLLSSSTAFANEHASDRTFVLVNEIPNSAPPKKNRMYPALIFGIGMVLSQIIPNVRNEKEWIHLWPCSILTFVVMMLTGCMSGDQARKSIMWDVYLAIAAAFGVSNAMESTGVAREFAQVFINIGDKIGSEGAALTAIYVATALLSEILTNNAAGAIMYPVAAIAGDQLGVAPRTLSIAIMLGASAGFINPFSYQCNMMVYYAGNYKTLEFAKIGAPFQAFLLIVAGFVLTFFDQWHQVWIVSFVALAAVVGFPLMWTLLPSRFTVRVELAVEGAWQRITRSSCKALRLPGATSSRRERRTSDSSATDDVEGAVKGAKEIEALGGSSSGSRSS